MHHLVLVPGCKHSRLGRLRAVFESQQHLHLGADGTTIELDRFLTATVEEQIRLDFHSISSSSNSRTHRAAFVGVGPALRQRRTRLREIDTRTVSLCFSASSAFSLRFTLRVWESTRCNPSCR